MTPISVLSMLRKVLCILKSKDDNSYDSFNLDLLLWSLHSPLALYWFIFIYVIEDFANHVGANSDSSVVQSSLLCKEKLVLPSFIFERFWFPMTII